MSGSEDHMLAFIPHCGIPHYLYLSLDLIDLPLHPVKTLADVNYLKGISWMDSC